MNTKDIESTLSKMTYDFDPFFHTRVGARIEEINESFGLKLSWSMLFPSIGLAMAILFFIVTQDGALNLDSLLGITEYKVDLENYLMYY
ncbi:MAG: hypothetical protein JXR19_08365 [Bacteroidia bacterium]